MEIVEILRNEETRLQGQLEAIRTAIHALDGHVSGKGPKNKATRKLSAAGRARIAKAARARWAKFRAQKVGKGKPGK